MKKILSVIMSAAIFMLILSACSNNLNDDVNYAITLLCKSENQVWEYNMSDEGVVSVTSNPSLKDDSVISYVFILESVGQGETTIDFSCIDKESGRITETVRYHVEVDDDYNIKAELVSETEESESPIGAINNEGEAQKVIEQLMLKENPSYEGELVFETQETQADIYCVRVFLLAIDDDGKTILKYLITYEVSGEGEITPYTESGIEDRPLTSK